MDINALVHAPQINDPRNSLQGRFVLTRCSTHTNQRTQAARVQRWGGSSEEIHREMSSGLHSLSTLARRSTDDGDDTTHIAIQEQFDGKAADWMELVSDEQYQPA